MPLPSLFSRFHEPSKRSPDSKYSVMRPFILSRFVSFVSMHLPFWKKKDFYVTDAAPAPDDDTSSSSSTSSYETDDDDEDMEKPRERIL